MHYSWSLATERTGVQQGAKCVSLCSAKRQNKMWVAVQCQASEQNVGRCAVPSVRTITAETTKELSISEGTADGVPY
jgi:hypothetical protein